MIFVSISSNSISEQFADMESIDVIVLFTALSLNNGFSTEVNGFCSNSSFCCIVNLPLLTSSMAFRS